MRTPGKTVIGLIPARLWKRKRPGGRIATEGSHDPRVRLCDPPRREPVKPVEQMVVEMLRRDGAVPFVRLVEQVASELYHEELRRGAWTLDLGLFGSGLFVRDVVRGLKAGNGILWEMERSGGQGDGILPDLA